MRLQTVRLFLLAAVTAAPLAAQSKIGIVGGLVSSNVTFSLDDISVDGKSLSGFAIGISRTGQSSGALTFAPEAMYVMKGFTLPSDIDTKLKLSYLEVPLLFRANIAMGSASAKPFIIGGPSLAYMLSCKGLDEDESANCSDDDIKKFDAGIMVGAGIQFGRIGVTARYDLGLMNFSSSDDVKFKNKALMLLANISF